LSAPDLLTGKDISTMAHDAIVFAMANPRPEVDPDEAAQYAAVVGTGRSDFANQINNVLAFPGVFRGLIDSQSSRVTDTLLLAAARALASVVTDEELNATYIIPSVFHPEVTSRVAAAVAEASRTDPVQTGELRPAPPDLMPRPARPRHLAPRSAGAPAELGADCRARRGSAAGSAQGGGAEWVRGGRAGTGAARARARPRVRARRAAPSAVHAVPGGRP